MMTFACRGRLLIHSCGADSSPRRRHAQFRVPRLPESTVAAVTVSVQLRGANAHVLIRSPAHAAFFVSFVLTPYDRAALRASPEAYDGCACQAQVVESGRSNPLVSLRFDDGGASSLIRVDDSSNLAMWFETAMPPALVAWMLLGQDAALDHSTTP